MISFLQKNNPYSHWEYLNQENGDRLRIVPERGGLITEWRSNGEDVLYFDQKRFLQKDKSVRGGIPVLFPICGDLTSESLKVSKGSEYRLSQHGFARDCEWDIRLLQDQLGVGLSLQDSHFTRLAFPYSFLLDIEVRLKRKTMQINIIITNNGDTSMPFSFGLHPYFNIADLQKLNLQGLNPICMNQVNMIEQETKDLIQKCSEGIDIMLFDSNVIKINDLVNGHYIELKQQAPMDITVVWTDPPRSMICVEPWTSPRNSLITGDRRLSVHPGGSCQLNTSISFRR